VEQFSYNDVAVNFNAVFQMMLNLILRERALDFTDSDSYRFISLVFGIVIVGAVIGRYV
jgi:hypothetical protein